MQEMKPTILYPDALEEACCYVTNLIHGRLLSKLCFFCTSQIKNSAQYANSHTDCLSQETRKLDMVAFHSNPSILKDFYDEIYN